MKRLTILLALTLGFSLSTPAFAGKKNKAEGKAGKHEVGAAIKAADKNGNHKIDDDELAALSESVNKAGADSQLKKLDHNSDGKIDSDEAKAINAKLEAKGEGKGKKKKAQ